MHERVVIERIDAFVFRCPTPRPVSTSFGVMRDRPAVFVRVEDRGGAFGWGEIFANWPSAGAEHRARLLMEDVADLVLGASVSEPSQLFRDLEAKTRIRAIQCGEPGPFRQVTAGLDIAMWDLFARRAGKPLARFLNAKSRAAVPAYASGIHVRDGQTALARARDLGFKAFKVKVGFDAEFDPAEVRRLCSGLAAGEALFADANQAWDLPAASEFLKRIEDAPLGWLEEPIPVDGPQHDWLKLSTSTAIPLAGGENIAGAAEFTFALRLGALSVIQPDVAKWGGITGCLAVARDAISNGRRYCPHFLGGGIGLHASAHLLAAVGGDGLLEVDLNDNPSRDLLAAIPERITADGKWRVGDEPGLGIEDLPGGLSAHRTLTLMRQATTLVAT